MGTKLDRRSLLGAGLALGLSASGSPAQESPKRGDTVPLTAAVEGGYDGSVQQAADQHFFPGWKQSLIETPGLTVDFIDSKCAEIYTLVGGSGPPLLLIHGNPESHVAWHNVAPELAKQFRVVLTDLRGYGDSSKPDGGIDHVDYCKRVMAQDQVTVMRSLGFSTFQAVAHDRGARVLQPMMSIYPEAVTRGVMLDIAPTSAMYGHTSEAFATKYRSRTHPFRRTSSILRSAVTSITISTSSARRRAPSQAKPTPNIYAVMATRRPSMGCVRIIERRRRSTSRLTLSSPSAGSRSRSSRSGAPRERSASFSTSSRCGGRWRMTSPARACPAVTSSPRRRRISCSLR